MNAPTKPITHRLSKVKGRRTRKAMFLTEEDIKELESESKRTGLSQSYIMLARYHAGKQAQKTA